MRYNGIFGILLTVLAVFFLFRIVIPVIAYLLPFALIAYAAWYFYNRYLKKEKPVKWNEGTMTDNYYEKSVTRPREDVIDVQAKVRERDDQNS